MNDFKKDIFSFLVDFVSSNPGSLKLGVTITYSTPSQAEYSQAAIDQNLKPGISAQIMFKPIDSCSPSDLAKIAFIGCVRSLAIKHIAEELVMLRTSENSIMIGFCLEKCLELKLVNDAILITDSERAFMEFYNVTATKATSLLDATAKAISEVFGIKLSKSDRSWISSQSFPSKERWDKKLVEIFTPILFDLSIKSLGPQFSEEDVFENGILYWVVFPCGSELRVMCENTQDGGFVLKYKI